ncbi:amino acid ABC transporter permease [Collinsella tanakaei]|uniref:Amino acid ABC transporter permease n=1 Tax=Collinsella ihumii TaxID=1720204 RepID=A0AAW7JMS8_9ACTN|nr:MULTISPECIES: amino acid ABC transporter permease [Collinsella]MBM6687687.1 amino acid ABC transporter permease [Collinsella tanakaei]MBM6777564.1 amino acid ABC transporter permease [Collinsella tanakaei]MBM6786298.1 amino acid ABC transporter permease [Collinsella tanakaei]MBM6904660.1 amino acid ABC transporter permease [Collinsella tanakaei]MCF6412462.1 amino acid ABC transporter permease [Collinsella tanakaei]
MEIFTQANVTFMLMGFVRTIEISVLAIIFSVILGTVLALAKQFCTGKLAIFKWLVSAYIELFRCTPNLLWILFIYFTVKGDDIFISVLAFTIFTSAVMAEIIRGGLNSIPKSQFEAARSQGFGFFASMRLIILPQTFKTIIPALFSQCTTVIKDSSYLAGINVAEFMFQSKVVMGYTTNLDQVLLVYGFVFALYFILNFGISLIVRAYQRRVVAA